METLNYYKELIALRKAHIALRRGHYRRLYADQMVYAFGREKGEDKFLIAVNAGSTEQTVDVPLNGLFADGTTLDAVFGQAIGTVENGLIKLTVPARDGVILMMKQ